MAFTFDATVGGTTSNSYPTLEQANDYFDGRYENDLWTGKSDAEKQRLLVSATRRIDAETFTSIKNDLNQSLQFPRLAAADRDGYIIDPNEPLPKNLINAVCELSYFMMQSDDRIMSEVELHDAEMMKNYKVGPLDRGFNRAEMDKLPKTVTNELKAIGSGVWTGEVNITSLTL
jgi:hypothetical protein